MPKYRLSVEFEARDLDDAWSEAQQYCDWGCEPSVKNMKEINFKVIEIKVNS